MEHSHAQRPLAPQAPEARNAGARLDRPTRARMERLLGHSFDDVRVHDDARAGEDARVQRSRAYTIGSDITFAPGAYAPRTDAGRRLIAHELTHVVQQRRGAAQRLERPASDAVEHEARGAADAVGAGRSFAPVETGPVEMARQDEAAPAAPAPAPEQEPSALGVQQLELARERIVAGSAAIADELRVLTAKPEPERSAHRARIHALERQLAHELAVTLRPLEERIAELQARAGRGEDLAGELEAANRELAENRADLQLLAGVFSPDKAAAFDAAYRTRVSGLNCMEAAQEGLAALHDPATAAAIRTEVERKAEAGLKRKKPVNLDQFITVMDTAHADKVAGPKQRARWSQGKKTWTPTLESLVRSRVSSKVPGFYFFGLALAEAYHSVLIGVSTWDQPRTLWCDQSGCRVVPGTLDAFARSQAESYGIGYGDWDTYVWQVLPPAAADVLIAPEEAP